MRWYQLGSGDKVSNCDGCGKKFRKYSRVIVNREYNTVTHPKCESMVIMRINDKMAKTIKDNLRKPNE